MTGTIINTITVFVGGILGTFLGTRLPDRMRQTVIHGLGMITLVVGIDMALGSENILLVLGSVLIGGMLGEWWKINDHLERLGKWLEEKASRYPILTRGDFTRGFITASLVFCVGPMTIVGSLQEGLTGDATLLILKSVLDGFAALAFAASMGMGVTFAALTVFLLQGSLTLGAGMMQGVLSDAMVAEMTATGGVLLLGIGLMILEIKQIRVANLLPALAIAPMLAPLWALLQGWLGR